MKKNDEAYQFVLLNDSTEESLRSKLSEIIEKII